MKTTWVPAHDVILDWNKTVTTRLFPGRFHDLFQPKNILAPLATTNTLEEERLKLQGETDGLIDKCLACQSIEQLERVLSETDPMTKAMYYDRIVFGTRLLDNMFPVKGNRECEIPKDWETFVSLLLHRKWFC